jgi:hypothetical protein
VAYGQNSLAVGMNAPVGLPVTGFGVAIFSFAASKIPANPPTLLGR